MGKVSVEQRAYVMVLRASGSPLQLRLRKEIRFKFQGEEQPANSWIKRSLILPKLRKRTYLNMSI